MPIDRIIHLFKDILPILLSGQEFFFYPFKVERSPKVPNLGKDLTADYADVYGLKNRHSLRK